MTTTKCFSSHCIFCTSQCSPSFTIINGKPVKLKSENGTQSQSFLSSNFELGAPDDSSIETHLKVIFILRKILNIGETTCSNFLGKCEGQFHPGLWISVCSSCDQLVGEFWEKLKEIGRLERRLKEIKSQLTGFVQDTQAFKGDATREDHVWNEIREVVVAGLGEAKASEKAEHFTFDEVDSIDDVSIPSPLQDNDPDFNLEMPNEEEMEDSNLYAPPSTEDNKTSTKPKRGRPPKPENVTNSSPKKMGKKLCYFKCPDCGDLSGNMVRFRQHQQLHKNGTGVTCAECGWLTQKLSSHMASWHSQTQTGNIIEKLANRIIKEVKTSNGERVPVPENAFESIRRPNGKRKLRCTLCPAAYTHLFRIRNHLEVHSSGNGIACEVCGWVMKPEKMSWHVGKVHGSKSKEVKKNPYKYPKKNYRFDCNDCPAYYTRLADLQNHKKLHNTGKGIVCMECGWLVQKLAQHKGKHHPKNSEGLKIKRKVESLENVRVSEEIPYYCSHCQMIYPTINKLITHVNSYHAAEGLLSCDSCESQFESTQLLKLHKKREHGEETEANEEDDCVQKCQFCDEVFESKMKKDFHVAKTHSDRLLFCVPCNLSFKGFGDFQRHMQTSRAHANQKRFACELCGKAYTENYALNCHMQATHYEFLGFEPPHKCSECGKVMANKGSLDDHMRSMHTKQFKFTCEYCAKGFNNRGRLVEHVTKKHQN
ncbi:putative zinc finger protein [Orchesella cincta]|uniref:Putative zinc finger protein n=1 Tax=Orchesella cincta TaxID=48709 RepID=A0A1D2MEC3_ORCCI|nr:putative zinc finger protein [Orchesella cincta]